MSFEIKLHAIFGTQWQAMELHYRYCDSHVMWGRRNDIALEVVLCVWIGEGDGLRLAHHCSTS
jgi:hypothetical protein